jgi:phospholipase C
MAFLGLQAFYDAAAEGTLPAISYIVGPMELSEHPPYSPHDGAWLQKNVVDAVTSSPKYNRTALIISYDETGGWGDHVVPYHSPEGTAIEWVADPYTTSHDSVYTGPGFRLPFYIVSPYTRGGAVFTEPSDHNSQLLFVEKWLAAKGTKLTTPNITPWRRAHMSDLTAAFDFANPDYSVPDLPAAQMPSKNSNGDWDGSVQCEAAHKNRQPPAPYNQTSIGNESVVRSAAAKLSQKGFKKTRGRLTEGRFLTFESKGYALTAPGKSSGTVTATKTASDRANKAQQWILHQPDAGLDSFTISSASNGRWLTKDGSLNKDESKAASFTISYNGGGKGYSMQTESGVLSVQGKTLKLSKTPASFDVYSVT